MTENLNNPTIELNDQIIKTLNYLIQLNIDSESGYQLAAANSNNTQYREMLEEYAKQRSHFATQLGMLLRREGENPAKTGTVAGVLREGWRNLKAALGSGDVAILAECMVEDETVIGAYQDAFAQISQEPLLAVLRHQFTDIRNAYERVKGLHAALNR